MNKIYLSQIIDERGGSRYSIFVLLLCCLAIMFDGYDYMIVSFTLPQISEELYLGEIAAGSLASWSMIGMMVGGFLGGVIADRIGRKKTLVFCVAVYSILTVPIFFVHSYDAFAICRIFSGIGIGAVIPLSQTLACEYAPTKHRGLFSTITFSSMMFGWVIAGLAAMYVVPNFGWRFCFLIGGIPLLYTIVLHFFLPESAHWLLSQGYYEEAMNNIKKIQAGLVKPKEYSYSDIKLPPPPEKVGLFAPFAKNYLRITVALIIICFCTSGLSYGITTWMPSLLLQSGLNLSTSYGYATLQNLAGVFGCFAAGFAADRFGRKGSALFSFVLTLFAIACMALGGSAGVMVLPSCILLGFSMNYSKISVQPIQIDSYRTEFRGTATAWFSTVSRLAGVITPPIMGAALAAGTTFARLMLAFIVPIVIAIFALLFFIKRETKGVLIEELADSKNLYQRSIR